ncbi:MAG: nicotinamide-nucleotide amidohydrolase family protein, partial [Chitinophagaceae bacterium]
GKMVLDEEALENVKKIFARFNRPMLESNYNQAMVPDGCTVIQNSRGTAPGMWFEKEGRIFVSMPGVPHEMKGMMTDFVIPRLSKYFTMPFILSRTLLTAGIGESFLSEMVKDVEQVLPENIKMAYLPNYGMVRLRLTGISADKELLEESLDEHFSKLKACVKDYLVTDEDQSIQQVVAGMLKRIKKTLATAESCTGGYIAHLLTAESGASEYFKGGIVSYSDEMKNHLLGVPLSVIKEAGAVSEAVVQMMVSGMMEQGNADYALAVSGVMGPGGGTEEKPVGTVWIAVGNRKTVKAQKFNFRYDRSRNIEMTANSALNMLRRFIQDESFGEMRIV